MMKKELKMTFWSIIGGVALGIGVGGLQAQEVPNQASGGQARAASTPEYDDYAAQMPSEYTEGGYTGACDPVADVGAGYEYADTGYYDYGGACGVGYDCAPCGVGYGGCGILPFIHDVAQVALLPVHWVASLLSCNSYADCGCGPVYQPNRCDPCDPCGNYVGGCTTCGVTTGDCGCGPMTNTLPNSDYLNYNTVGRNRQNFNRQPVAAAPQQAPQPTYQYAEQAIPQTQVQRPAPQAQRMAAVPQNRPPQRTVKPAPTQQMAPAPQRVPPQQMMVQRPMPQRQPSAQPAPAPQYSAYPATQRPVQNAPPYSPQGQPIQTAQRPVYPQQNPQQYPQQYPAAMPNPNAPALR